MEDMLRVSFGVDVKCIQNFCWETVISVKWGGGGWHIGDVKRRNSYALGSLFGAGCSILCSVSGFDIDSVEFVAELPSVLVHFIYFA
jgi:hypothetical protein